MKNETALQGPVRVRFPPSPTGFLHVGGARTAIYNDLLRRSLGGALVLRIEDTDRARSDEAMTLQITSALEWIEVGWDEGPFLQSERVERHRENAQRLLDAGHAYRCYRTPAELDELREKVKAEGGTLRQPVLALPEDEVARREADGAPSVLRFRMPDGDVVWEDLVRGEVVYPPAALDDFVLLRSDGSPTYHLSVVSDDLDMEVSHILRGDDHISNTPKHIALMEALGGTLPRFGHVPMILGPDKKRLSKRTGATSVEEFRDQGILPEALYNYLVLLGWSPGDDLEIMSREQMSELFTVERLRSSAAVFDPEKLAWFNGHYMADLPLETILGHLERFLPGVGLGEVDDRERLEAAVELHRPRAKDLVELAQALPPYFVDRHDYDPERCGKYIGNPDLPEQVETLARRYREAPEYTIEALERILRDLAEELGVKAGILIHPTRMALSATKTGPPLFDLVALMGREASDRHFAHFLDFLRAEQAKAADG